VVVYMFWNRWITFPEHISLEKKIQQWARFYNEIDWEIIYNFAIFLGYRLIAWSSSVSSKTRIFISHKHFQKTPYFLSLYLWPITTVFFSFKKHGEKTNKLFTSTLFHVTWFYNVTLCSYGFTITVTSVDLVLIFMR
jgi:hypothetical protein